MRHIYIRGILSLIWFIAAIVCFLSNNFLMMFFSFILGCVFLYFAYVTWKKEKDRKGDK